MNKILILLFITSLSSSLFASVARSESVEYVKQGLIKAMIYRPTNLTTNSSTVLALPGCTQSSEDFFALTHLKKYADQYGAMVIVPEQSLLKNPLKCWNWFSHFALKNKAETKKIMNLVKGIQQRNALASDKLFVIGFSAGAAMANIIASCYINDVRAVAVHDGVHYGAFDKRHPIRFLKNGKSKSINSAVQEAFECNQTIPQKTIGAIILQGEDVKLIPEKFAHHTFQFYKKLNERLDPTLMNAEIIKNFNDNNPQYPVTGQVITNGNVFLIEEYVIGHLKHAWSGGLSGYRFSNEKSVDGTEMIFNFFTQFDL